jgi:hypothetical protein
MRQVGRLVAIRPWAAGWSGAAGVRKRLRDARRGTAAVEFALLLPVMVALLGGMTDACLGLVAFGRVTAAAEETALIATATSVVTTGSTTGSLSLTPGTAPNSLFAAATAIFGLIPGLKSAGSAQPFSVTVSEIVFVGSPSGCVPSLVTASGSLQPCASYTANVAWSVPLSSLSAYASGSGNYLGISGGAAPKRACGTMTQVAQTQSATFTTIPTLGMTNLTSVLVADVTYQYLPLFTQVFVGPITFMHTAMLPPRLTPVSTFPQYITYDTSSVTYNGSGVPISSTDSNVCASNGYA